MRLSVVQYGRDLQVLNLHADPPHLLQPSTLGERVKRGDLSVKTGQQILDLFRSQVPVNPFIYSQIDESNLKSNQTYLITTHRQLQRDIQFSLGDQIRFYRNEEGILFDGHHPPDVFVFESSLSRERVLKQPLMDLQYPGDPAMVPYVWLPDSRSMKMFFSGQPPPITVNLVLSGTRDIPSDFLSRVQTVYVTGRNARFLGPGDRVSDIPLILTRSSGRIPYAEGRVVPPAPELYLGGLMVLGLGVMIYGARSDDTRGTWLIWTTLFIGSALLLERRQPLMVGLLTGGLLRLGWLQSYRRAVWFLMAGLLTFGVGFAPDRLDPLAGVEYLWVGLILGFILMLPVLQPWWTRTANNREWVLGGASVGLLYGILWMDSYPSESFPLIKGLVLTGLPLLSRFEKESSTLRSWTWLVGFVGWIMLLVKQPSSVTWIGFALSLFLWEWERNLRGFVPSTIPLPWRGENGR